MKPAAQPSDTEFSYPHRFQPHPYLFTQSAIMRPPINPKVPFETTFTLAELETRNDLMPAPTVYKPASSKKKSSGSKKKQ